MAMPELWQTISSPISAPAEWPGSTAPQSPKVLEASLTRRTPSETVAEFAAIPFRFPYLSSWDRLIKRTLDLVFSSLALLLFSPVLLVIALAVKLDSPGPVFYISERL